MTEPSADTFGAKLEYTLLDGADGFSAPTLPVNVQKALKSATQEVFGEDREPFYVGCGGSIPFMEVFMREFPGTNFMLTGCCFPDSNAHAANENLDLKFCAKLTSVIALILAKI